MPGLISAGIFAFTLSWNEFIYALTFIQSSENKTVPVGVLTELVRGDIFEWGALMAGRAVRLAAGRHPLFVLRRLLRLVDDRRGEGINGESAATSTGRAATERSSNLPAYRSDPSCQSVPQCHCLKLAFSRSTS